MSTIFVSGCAQARCFASNGAGANFKANACSQVNAALNQFVNATALPGLRFSIIFKLEFFAATNTVLGGALQKR